MGKEIAGSQTGSIQRVFAGGTLLQKFQGRGRLEGKAKKNPSFGDWKTKITKTNTHFASKCLLLDLAGWGHRAGSDFYF
ncbi:MAG: hypothetical protein N4A65_03025 [Cohaesibacter sp.]|nr:hypothetical protein [Cohaesibacter sp.]